MARTLSNSGYTNVRIMRGGYDGWKLAGGPVEEKAGAATAPVNAVTPAAIATPTAPIK